MARGPFDRAQKRERERERGTFFCRRRIVRRAGGRGVFPRSRARARRGRGSWDRYSASRRRAGRRPVFCPSCEVTFFARHRLVASWPFFGRSLGVLEDRGLLLARFSDRWSDPDTSSCCHSPTGICNGIFNGHRTARVDRVGRQLGLSLAALREEPASRRTRVNGLKVSTKVSLSLRCGTKIAFSRRAVVAPNHRYAI